MNNFTSGNWTFNEIGSSNGEIICSVKSSTGVEVASYLWKDDAKLVAAAPELLTALIDMVNWLDDGNRQLSDSCATDVSIARAAIKKATGAA